MTRESSTQHQPAAGWLRQFDTGRDGFLPKMAFLAGEYGELSPGQWAAVERIMAEHQDRPAQPGRPAQPERRGEAAPVGVYRQDGNLYVVREFTPQGESRKVRYARQIIPLTGAQGDRLNQQGERVRIEERKVPGMQYRLTAADALPMEEVTALSIQWEHCLVCGRPLRVAESVERGIGPVCYGRQMALLGG